MGHAFNATLRR